MENNDKQFTPELGERRPDRFAALELSIGKHGRKPLSNGGCRRGARMRYGRTNGTVQRTRTRLPYLPNRRRPPKYGKILPHFCGISWNCQL